MPETKTLWQCPKCRRRFERHGQTHSCKPFALEQHFEGKAGGRRLYEHFKKIVRKQIGPFQVESLACCIHLVCPTTFAAVKIFKEKMQVDFSLDRLLQNKRIAKFSQMSANSYLYVVEVTNNEDINKELLDWLMEAYEQKRMKAGLA